MGRRPPSGDDAHMTSTRGAVPSARPGPARGTRSTAALRATVGVAWLGLAIGCAWLAFATPALGSIVRLDTASLASQALGITALAVAMVAPAAFAIMGLVRLAGAIAGIRHGSRTRSPVTRLARRLPPDCHVIPRIQLPDGRRIPDVVVGPHGVTAFELLPPAAASRQAGGHWEVRFDDGAWRSIESPLQRAARDADRLRGHLAAQELDFVVRVQAAVIGDPATVDRTESCAVVALDDVPAWLQGLPAQRGLSPDRLAAVREALERLA